METEESKGRVMNATLSSKVNRRSDREEQIRQLILKNIWITNGDDSETVGSRRRLMAPRQTATAVGDSNGP